MTNYTSHEIKALLKENVVTVKFTKKDGSERIMKASLMEDHIPPGTSLYDPSKVSYPEYQIRCIDTEIGEWRSFDLDTVISVEV